MPRFLQYLTAILLTIFGFIGGAIIWFLYSTTWGWVVFIVGVGGGIVLTFVWKLKVRIGINFFGNSM